MDFDNKKKLKEFIGKNIESAMNSAGVNASQLGKLIGKTGAAIGYWLSGQQIPVMWTAYKVSKILNVPLDELIFGKNSLPMVDASGSVGGFFSMVNSRRKGLFAMEISEGDRMNSPKIDPGDVVIVREADSVSPDEFAVVLLGKGTQIAVLRCEQGLNGLVFKALNGDQPGEKQKVEIKGVVIAIYRGL